MRREYVSTIEIDRETDRVRREYVSTVERQICIY